MGHTNPYTQHLKSTVLAAFVFYSNVASELKRVVQNKGSSLRLEFVIFRTVVKRAKAEALEYWAANKGSCQP